MHGGKCEMEGELKNISGGEIWRGGYFMWYQKGWWGGEGRGGGGVTGNYGGSNKHGDLYPKGV